MTSNALRNCLPPPSGASHKACKSRRVQARGKNRTQDKLEACRTHTFNKVNKVVGNRDLGANVAKLRKDGQEEVGLLAKRSHIVSTNNMFLDAPSK